MATPLDDRVVQISNGGISNEAFDSNGDVIIKDNVPRRLSLKNDTYQNGNQHRSGVVSMDGQGNLESEYKCGYGSCVPIFLQRFHNAKCLVFILCLCAITQGIVINGLIPVSITTLEKRFHLSSTASGIFASMYDIAVLLVLVPLSHFGGKGHKGRYLGWGVIVMGIGSFICALPQFTTDAYDYGQSAPRDTCELAPANVTGINCPEITGDSGSKIDRLRMYFYVLLLGQLFHGIGASPLYTLGITFIDENTSQRASPVYLGVYIGFSTVGPALGFIIGGMLLRVYGDVGKVDLDTVHISNDDPRWYGAWWIGFVMTAAMAFIFSFPMLSFARELPEARQHRLKDVDQTNRRGSTDGAITQAFNGSAKELWISFVKIIKNPTFTCLMIMQVAESFLLNGFTAFLPKLVENIFSLSPSAIVVPFGFGGTLLGGYIVRRFKLLCKSIILVALAFQAASVLFVFAMLIECPKQSFIGISSPYLEGRSLGKNQLLDSCNAHCQCDEYYQPVCNEFEHVSYFSPCMAGCRSKSNGDSKVWSDCQCVQQRIDFTNQSIIQSNNASSPDSVKDGLCSASCAVMPLFFVLFSIEILLIFSSAMPIQQAELRCVPFQLRTLAVGLRWIFARLLGAIPGLIGFGAAIDTTCIFWEEKCGQRASCLRYDSRRMALSILGCALAIKAIVITSLFLAWKLYKPPPNAAKAVESPVDHGWNKVTPVESPNEAANRFEMA